MVRLLSSSWVLIDVAKFISSSKPAGLLERDLVVVSHNPLLVIDYMCHHGGMASYKTEMFCRFHLAKDIFDSLHSHSSLLVLS